MLDGGCYVYAPTADVFGAAPIDAAIGPEKLVAYLDVKPTGDGVEDRRDRSARAGHNGGGRQVPRTDRR